jgi:hypothetical protein
VQREKDYERRRAKACASSVVAVADGMSISKEDKVRLCEEVVKWYPDFFSKEDDEEESD